ncbi:MAG: sigma-70 family RNA polymerase sigma factor [Polyangiaceae bacterium]|nr:sigma-70 family RNA polymerase sigma factor [Polyangiaceae bacterium]
MNELVAPLVAKHARRLWGVCFRMTGNGADADDLVQETFLRAVERPPEKKDEPWEPWLLTVAMNLSRDALRKRKRRSYVGPWLPTPVDDAEWIAPEVEGEAGTEGKYDIFESVTLAFLLALEVLSVNERAVVVLRDVFDRSVRETADALQMSEANVKVIHHRARAKLAPYDQARDAESTHAQKTKCTQEALQRFLAALSSGNEADLVKLFALDVESLSDGGGHYFAAKIVVIGAERVAKMLATILRKSTPVTRADIRSVNATPTLVGERGNAHRGEAPFFTMSCDVDRAGKITRVYTVLAPAKLAKVATFAT